jgi:Ni/Fe-hydrogenase subunit HybB-like protein
MWFKKLRYNLGLVFIVCMSVSVGMWLERFVIVVTSLHRDFLPSSWGMYYPTIWDWAIYIGTIGLFFTLIFLFIRVLPAINMFEMKHLLRHKEHEAHELEHRQAAHAGD